MIAKHNSDRISVTLESTDLPGEPSERRVVRAAHNITGILHEAAARQLAEQPDDRGRLEAATRRANHYQALGHLLSGTTVEVSLQAHPTLFANAAEAIEEATHTQTDVHAWLASQVTGQPFNGSGILDGINPAIMPVSPELYDLDTQARTPAADSVMGWLRLLQDRLHNPPEPPEVVVTP